MRITPNKTVQPSLRRGELLPGQKDALWGIAFVVPILSALIYRGITDPPTPEQIEYGPSQQLVKADKDNNGILSKQEAIDLIERRFGLTPKGLAQAKEFGEQASKHLPIQGEVFLKVVEQLQAIHGLDNKEK